MRKFKKLYRNILSKIYEKLGMKDRAILTKFYKQKKEGNKVFKVVLLLIIINLFCYAITLL